MDYKEKVIALFNSQELSKEQKEKLENIFPELKESEDERIRKELIKAVSRIFEGHKLFNTDVTREEALAWLEKQGEQTHAKLGQSEVTKTSEQELPDKIEPKFKVGNWIIFNGLILHIDEIVNGYYRTTSIGDGIHNSYDWDIDNAARLWTIQEAKDGDVLVILPKKGSESNEQIFLFKAINSRDYVDNCIEYYCRLCDGAFYKNKTGYMGTTLDTFYPATKEQCDLLFSKMKEAGYEWDADKKELKKIEPKTLDADKVIAWLVANIQNNEYFVKWFKKDFGL